MIFVSVVYGEISPKARTRLWGDLVEHKGFVNNNPWVVLGDFNAVLRFNENSNGLNIQGAGIKDFRECIDSLELEDINMTGLFYTWIQKMRNPELGVLKKLDRISGIMPFHTSRILRFANFLADKADFVDIIRENWDIDVKGYKMFKLARKLKNMKKYMRQMNRRNGNVFEKVKVLKDELSKIQCNLDKDLTNDVLKEEEMMYYSAYREAALDEEKLLKQKTKIEWLLGTVIPMMFGCNQEFFTSMKLLGEFNTTLISRVLQNPETPARGLCDYRRVPVVTLMYKANNYGTGCCAFKIDIMKAYDTVSWSFLEFCLKEFGFHPVMINWIMVCLKTASFSVCVNGESHGFFKAERDDLLMLCHGDVVSASILRRGLDEFSLASGLYPSMSKSEAFFSNVCPDAKNEILMAMPFREGTLPISCNVWFDKWNSNGPLSKLIDHRTIVQFGFSLKDKVYWVNKKGKEKSFNVAEVWKAIKPKFPKIGAFPLDRSTYYRDMAHDCMNDMDSMSDMIKRGFILGSVPIGGTGLWECNRIWNHLCPCYDSSRSALINVMKIKLASVYAPMFYDGYCSIFSFLGVFPFGFFLRKVFLRRQSFIVAVMGWQVVCQGDSHLMSFLVDGDGSMEFVVPRFHCRFRSLPSPSNTF
ncbi:RNA-directed DNA polymerase, eukaryota, reverse transcriptase zinc-binding domain protein [Tanacetum coccineum]